MPQLGGRAGWVVVAAALSALPFVLASAERGGAQSQYGVRLQLGNIAGTGGPASAAFVPMPPEAISTEVLAGIPCEGLRLAASGEFERGPARVMHLTMNLTSTTSQGRLGVGACPGATITIELEDGTSLTLDQGGLDLRQVDLAGGRVEGRFDGTGSRGGTLVTVTGDLRLSFVPPGAR